MEVIVEDDTLTPSHVYLPGAHRQQPSERTEPARVEAVLCLLTISRDNLSVAALASSSAR